MKTSKKFDSRPVQKTRKGQQGKKSPLKSQNEVEKSRSRSKDQIYNFNNNQNMRITRQQLKFMVNSNKQLDSSSLTSLFRNESFNSIQTRRGIYQINNQQKKRKQPSITTADTYSNYDQYEEQNSQKTIKKTPKSQQKQKKNIEIKSESMNIENEDSQLNSTSATQSIMKNSSPRDSTASNDNKRKSKDAGHFEYEIGQILNKKFQILRHLGDGTFGRVLEVKDLKSKKILAAKIIRAVERYIQSAQLEAEIIQKLNSVDSKQSIVKLYDAFHEGENYVMVFEKLGPSLYDFMKDNNFLGYPINYVQTFAKQLLIAVGMMHENNYTHTDLKPENILLSSEKQILTYNRNQIINPKQIPQDFEETSDKKNQNLIKLPFSDKLKLIDFGNATHASEHHSTVINTRQYRAPEVILQCQQWNEKSDMWSIGCIIMELYNGDLLFQTHESYEHLAMIEKILKQRIPLEMAENVHDDLKQNFTIKKNNKKSSYFDWPKHASTNKSINKVQELKSIDELVDPKHHQLADLIKKLLQIDPNDRIDCKEALEHPFFKINYGQIEIKQKNQSQK